MVNLGISCVTLAEVTEMKHNSGFVEIQDKLEAALLRLNHKTPRPQFYSISYLQTG